MILNIHTFIFRPHDAKSDIIYKDMLLIMAGAETVVTRITTWEVMFNTKNAS
jgi:hypothetical protein